MMRIVMLGAGDHARVLLSVLRLRGLMPVAVVAPNAPDDGWPRDVPYAGGDEVIASYDAAQVQLVNGVGSVKSTVIRAQVFARAQSCGLDFLTLSHPRAIVADDAAIGVGVQVMAGAIVQTGACLGDNVLINTGAIVDHDCRIGASSHVAPGVRLSGSVVVGEGSHIGTGAVVIQGIRIGNGATVGAGAVVVRDVADGLVVVGNPARAKV